MLYKLENGKLIAQPNKITIGSATTWNPTDEQLLALGWKPRVVEEQPEVEEGYHLEAVFAETDNAIIQDWQIVENPPEEPDPQEILDILLGGDAE